MFILNCSYKKKRVSDQVWWCKDSFWVIPQIASANLCRSVHDTINYFTSICPSESGKFGKEGNILQKFEYLENEKNYLDEIKFFFHSF